MSSENVVCSSEIKLAFNTSTFQIVFYSSCIFLLVLFYIFCSCSWHLHSGCVVIVVSLYSCVLEVFPSLRGLSFIWRSVPVGGVLHVQGIGPMLECSHKSKINITSKYAELSAIHARSHGNKQPCHHYFIYSSLYNGFFLCCRQN